MIFICSFMVCVLRKQDLTGPSTDLPLVFGHTHKHCIITSKWRCQSRALLKISAMRLFNLLTSCQLVLSSSKDDRRGQSITGTLCLWLIRLQGMVGEIMKLTVCRYLPGVTQLALSTSFLPAPKIDELIYCVQGVI